MSKQATNNEELNGLFHKVNGSDDLPLDDFEKEALEGFALLSDKESAFKIKADLDVKIYDEIFTKKEKKKAGKIIWYAAAGLFLIIGFSIYFIRTNSFVRKDAGLAINSIKKTPVQASEVQVEEKQKEDVQANQSDRTEESKAEVGPRNELKEKKAKGLAEISNLSDQKTKVVANEADEEQVEASKPVVAATPILYTNKNEEISSNNSADLQKEQSDKKNKDDETVAFTATKNSDEARQMLKKAGAKREEGLAANNFAAPQASSSEKTPLSNCVYEGGELSLFKDLKEMLATKNLKLKFDAVLFIDENRKVEKVKLTNSFDLSAEQEKQVVEILKSLTKFNFRINPSDKSLAEYKLAFRP